MNQLIEVRSLNLKPGALGEFHRLYIAEALPRLKRWDFDIVAHGPSLDGANAYYVIRRYKSLTQREQMEDAYYASHDWRQGPREALLALIEHYVDIVLEVDDVAIRGLREGGDQIIDLRSYALHTGSRDEYHRLFVEEAFPMLKRLNVDVVRYGFSLHDGNTYYLIRAYAGLAQRAESENAFYGSEEWRLGPREAVLALIENHTEVVLGLDEATLQALRA